MPLVDAITLAALASVAHTGSTPLFATVSGAHLYGFASRDSDIDLRGAFVLPLNAVLRLREPEETITLPRLVEQSSLPSEPDTKAAEALVIDLQETFLFGRS